MIKIDNVLVPIDFSEPSDSALTYGRTLARTFGGRLHVLHVVDNSVLFAGVDGYVQDVAAVLSDMVEDAEKRILTCLTEDDWKNPKTLTDVRTGGPAAEIARYARDENIDLIVMGNHGRGFVRGLLMGRVAEKVVRIAPCPVLTVRAGEREFVIPDPVGNATEIGNTR